MKSKDKLYGQAAICGRFQPFHSDHYRYFESALKISDIVWIGVTQPFNSALSSCTDAPHRAEAASNPLSFYERFQCIDLTLQDHNIDRRSYRIVPFPIDDRSQLSSFLPPAVPILTTKCDDWNDKKKTILEEQRFRVVNLYDNLDAVVRGSVIRQQIRDNKEQWRSSVTQSVFEFLQSIGFECRVRESTASIIRPNASVP